MSEIIDVGELNTFYIDVMVRIKDLEAPIAAAFLTNASFSEFQDLPNQYLSENDDFNGGLFMRYLAKNGFYGHVIEGAPLSPHMEYP